jgi:hypothetical protein
LFPLKNIIEGVAATLNFFAVLGNFEVSIEIISSYSFLTFSIIGVCLVQLAHDFEKKYINPVFPLILSDISASRFSRGIILPTDILDLVKTKICQSKKRAMIIKIIATGVSKDFPWEIEKFTNLKNKYSYYKLFSDKAGDYIVQNKI